MNKKITLIVAIVITIFAINSICFAASGDYDSGFGAGYEQGFDEGYSEGLGAGKERVPIVDIVETNDLIEVAAGDTLELKIEFKNSSVYSARKLTITPDLEGTPLVYERPLKYMTTKSLQGGDKGSTTFNIKVSNDAKVGTYSINFKIEYTNNRDEAFSRDGIAYFKVTSEKLRPILTISNIHNSLETIKAGDRFDLSFDLTNIGGSEAKNLEVSLDGFGQTTLMPIDARDYNYIGSLAAKEISKQTFGILTSEEISQKNNTITVNVSYRDADDQEYTLTKNIYITGVDIGDNTSDDDGDNSAKPKMIISSYGLNPTDITAGKVFDLNFTFKNTSKDKRIRNIKITVSSEEGAFIITKGSNTFYIEEMDKDASISRSIELKAKQDLASNSYQVHIAFDYEDFSGKEYNSVETLNIPVTEYSKLVINSVYAGEGYVNSNVSLSFDYVNMGKATVSNLTASVEGDYTSVQEINYIGNLTAGNSDYYDIEVTPTKEGLNHGVLVLAFEDSSGGIIEVRKEFEGNAFAENFFDDPGDVPPIDDQGFVDVQVEPETQIPGWQIALYGFGTFIVLFFVTKIITTKIIRKRLEDEL